ncbi:hypothetical protein [Bacillus subtilis]|uniref:hypothetical protein n=1 Tax=Bacillus subtilis TaxID=1423 RepID=UPI001425CA3B|nr:hypothetical protein [Bacillus subtilis]MEC2237492.1 hypothetical protein [Bacillus subtilis]QIR19009.1 hypothetical protein F0366_12625 [Bacillus subtilis]WBY36046.1 hypothetical protein PF977_12990 [Bacillus subtilis]CAF1782134.1 hypothetical protein NRS6111_03856 [Bacillus subtilis]
MATDMRIKPVVTGKDAERFLERVKRNNERIEARRAKRKAMMNRVPYGKQENRLVKN